METPFKHHLPRLPADYYRGLAFVHWTLTIEGRATGWLTTELHWHWRLVLLHTCSRYFLAAPVYVLMPDHIHVLLLGFEEGGSDQRVAIEFLRRQLQRHLTPARWQRQAFEHVLTESQRERGSFQAIAHYIRDNPFRANLVSEGDQYPFLGCCVPGYPEFSPLTDDFWERFWRCYNFLVEKRNG